MHGWALVDEGEQVSLGLTELQEGLAGWLKTGARVYAPYFTCCFAEACLSADRPDDGLEPLARMIEMVERTGERWWQPELYRLTGELASKAAVAGEYGADPEQYFRKALDLATQQGARSLELRATMSLCKRWMHQKEKRTTARRSLAAIYDTFNEGASTRDMLTARKLLQELSRH
jgi:predicted ATPase